MCDLTTRKYLSIISLKPFGIVSTILFAAYPAYSVAQNNKTPSDVSSSRASPVVTAPIADIAARLRENNASPCGSQINAAGAAVLVGASQYDTLSNWNPKGGGQRTVNVAVAQRYPAGERIPSGVSAIVATPVSPGRCDMVAVQVVPSPLSCDAVRSAMGNRSQARGQLVGVSVMQRGPTETLLVPTGNNTCVVVDLTTTYAQ